jgi:PAS domain S-box-containing protein
MKAAQALSEIIHLDRLIAPLIQMVIENAGAERGALVLLEADQLIVVAQCSVSRVCDLEKLAVADCATIPVSIIHSVECTQETLVLDDAVSESPFSTDPYIQHQQTRSLLCMPILKQSQLIGILYLENNLSAGLFTRDRLQALKLLIDQAAISLENARLYEQLADYAETLERKVEEQTQALQQESTERQQTEAALRRSEAKFRNFFENSQVGIFRVRLSDGLLLDANQRHANLFGFDSPEEIIGLEYVTGYYADPSDHQHLIELLKQDREVRSLEVQMRKRDGTLFWGLFSLYLNAGDDYTEGVIADISDRKQVEAALCEREQELRLITDALPVYISYVDADQRYRFVNHAYEVWFNRSRDEIIGKSVREIQSEAAYQITEPYIKRLLGGQTTSFEAEIPKGSNNYISATHIPHFGADGQVKGYYGLIADISDRKRAEAALQTSEERLRLALTAANQGLYDLNIKTEEVVVNPEYALMLGYDPATFHVTKSRWIESLHPDDRESVLAVYHACITGEVPSYQAEYRHRTQDGQWKWILAVGNVVAWNESGEPIRALGVVTDIDDCKRAEAASILEERNRMAREIHDTLAQSFTGILAQVGAANQVLTDDLEATQAHLDLIKELARTGLTEARRSVVALRPQLLEEGSLQSALHRLIAQIRTAAMDTTLYYEIEGAVYVLPTEIESNLLRMGQEALTNAIKHANADEIRVELVYDRDQFCLRVKDNGQGFGVGSIPSSEGFGLLGMSERAERIGAQLTIRSQPGQGTEIIVTVNRE